MTSPCRQKNFRVHHQRRELIKHIKANPFIAYGISIWVLNYGLSFFDYDQGGIVTIFYLILPVLGAPFGIIGEIMPNIFGLFFQELMTFLIGMFFCFLCDLTLRKIWNAN